jgi:hypothetical protein
MSDETFDLPLPPPLPPLPPGHHGERDVIFFRRQEHDVREERESEDIMLRSVPKLVAQHFRGAAGGRGMTHAQYLAALVELHQAMRERADGGDTELAAALDALGLSTISI